MKYIVDPDFIRSCFRELVETPSPVGYYVQGNPLLEKMAARLGYGVTFDNRSTAYITLPGRDNSKTVLIGAHMDTLGMIVRRIDPNGAIRVRQLGGVNFHSVEGETVTVHTRDGRSYTGLATCQSHSIHVFEDCRTSERSEDTMLIFLDEPVTSREEVLALGIRHGDVISIDPRCQFTENGYIKSRFIDDKGAVACCFALLKYLKDNQLQPQYRTILAFPYTEEVNTGGTYIPEGVSEMIAMDIGLIGPDNDGTEFGVSICAKDNSSPYDYELTTRLAQLAEKIGCKYALDIYYRYGTDGNAAIRAGNNLRAGVFGMPVLCSHGMERTHIDSFLNTTDLLIAYTLGE